MNFPGIAHESPIHAPSCDAETRTAKLSLGRSDILDFDDWKVRCHRALRASGFFIVLLSPAYLRSDTCRWEWEE